MTDAATHPKDIRHLRTAEAPLRKPKGYLTQRNAVEIAVDALTHPCILCGGWCRNNELVHDPGAFHGPQSAAWIKVRSLRGQPGHAATGRNRQKNCSVGSYPEGLNRKHLTFIAPHCIADRVTDRHWSCSAKRSCNRLRRGFSLG